MGACCVTCHPRAPGAGPWGPEGKGAATGADEGTEHITGNEGGSAFSLLAMAIQGATWCWARAGSTCMGPSVSVLVNK